ncbi:hypothetical protein M0802_000267 [Mischocyttarus mexicanus]|nr:hypothetical protein M0802_000267 [Mischocyttarus mexicanus]
MALVMNSRYTEVCCIPMDKSFLYIPKTKINPGGTYGLSERFCAIRYDRFDKKNTEKVKNAWKSSIKVKRLSNTDLGTNVVFEQSVSVLALQKCFPFNLTIAKWLTSFSHKDMHVRYTHEFSVTCISRGSARECWALCCYFEIVTSTVLKNREGAFQKLTLKPPLDLVSGNRIKLPAIVDISYPLVVSSQTIASALTRWFLT